MIDAVIMPKDFTKNDLIFCMPKNQDAESKERLYFQKFYILLQNSDNLWTLQIY